MDQPWFSQCVSGGFFPEGSQDLVTGFADWESSSIYQVAKMKIGGHSLHFAVLEAVTDQLDGTNVDHLRPRINEDLLTCLKSLAVYIVEQR